MWRVCGARRQGGPWYIQCTPQPIEASCSVCPPAPPPAHRKRRTVQAQLVGALAALMPPGARVFLQSDVLEASKGASQGAGEGGAWLT